MKFFFIQLSKICNIKRRISLIIIIIYISFSLFINAQQYSFGWQGEEIIQAGIFLDAHNWTPNQSDLLMGDSCYVTADSVLNLHWKLGKGLRQKWVQCYIWLSEPVNLADKDIIGIDIRGSDCNHDSNRHVELKFEDGKNGAVYTWDNLAQIYRWCDRLTLVKKQFSNCDIFNWDSVKVISFAITMNISEKGDTLDDTGTISFRNLIAQSIDSFERADSFEPLNEIDIYILDTVKSDAAAAILERQAPTGLIYTWKIDYSSWLYGQGLALKVLTEEGIWVNSAPVNNFAVAASNLAHFLSENQEEMGFWPRAWNANSGNHIVYVEYDSTVWMGDFPWILSGLLCYYKKSGDDEVIASINKAKLFLYNLIDNDGKVNTINVYTYSKKEVNNYEGYAATIYCLFELGDTLKAQKIIDYLLLNGWDNELSYWREGPGSSRPVLLVNTWFAPLFSIKGYENMAIEALSLAGKLLYTKGPGEPSGLDGVGPVATWYEGTLSYISAKGPGSNSLFNEIRNYINTDGTIPAYNDSVGSMAGVWAVNWSSLDATSWLYYAAAGKSPFAITETADSTITFIYDFTSDMANEEINIYNHKNKIYITSKSPSETGRMKVELYSTNGILIGTTYTDLNRSFIDINDIVHNQLLHSGIYLIKLYHNNQIFTQKLVSLNP